MHLTGNLGLVLQIVPVMKDIEKFKRNINLQNINLLFQIMIVILNRGEVPCNLDETLFVRRVFRTLSNIYDGAF